jgi:hypothetical protein
MNFSIIGLAQMFWEMGPVGYGITSLMAGLKVMQIPFKLCFLQIASAS